MPGKEPDNPGWLGNVPLIYKYAGADTVPADASVDSGIWRPPVLALMEAYRTQLVVQSHGGYLPSA